LEEAPPERLELGLAQPPVLVRQGKGDVNDRPGDVGPASELPLPFPHSQLPSPALDVVACHVGRHEGRVVSRLKHGLQQLSEVVAPGDARDHCASPRPSRAGAPTSCRRTRCSSSPTVPSARRISAIVGSSPSPMWIRRAIWLRLLPTWPSCQ